MLFSGKNKKNTAKCYLLFFFFFLPIMLNVNNIKEQLNMAWKLWTVLFFHMLECHFCNKKLFTFTLYSILFSVKITVVPTTSAWRFNLSGLMTTVNILKFHTLYSILHLPLFCFLIFFSFIFSENLVEWLSVDPDQTAPWSSLIWICTVCSCHFVRKAGVQNIRTTTILKC